MPSSDPQEPARFGNVESSAGDLVPRPDPTTLTTAIVNTAKADLRRELASLRELLETRINTVEIVVQRQERSIRRIPTNLERTAKSLHTEIDRRLRAHDREEEQIRKEIVKAVGDLERLHEERFAAIHQQFAERDIRTDQDKKSSKEALDAALLAAKDAVAQQNEANTTAATKSETSFTKQIDSVDLRIGTIEKSLSDRITELKERIDRGEGGLQGVQTDRTERRAGSNLQIAVAGLLISLVFVVLALAAATHGFTK